MPWRGASHRPKRLANCAVCWMITKGAGDEHDDELAFPWRDAIFGLGSTAFSLAGDCARGSRCGCDGLVPSGVNALCAGRWCAGADAFSPVGNFLLRFAAAFPGARDREVFVARCRSLDNNDEHARGTQFGANFFAHVFAECPPLAGGGLAFWRGVLQPSFCRWISADRA